MTRNGSLCGNKTTFHGAGLSELKTEDMSQSVRETIRSEDWGHLSPPGPPLTPLPSPLPKNPYRNAEHNGRQINLYASDQ